MDNLLYYHMLGGGKLIKYATDSRYIFRTLTVTYLWDAIGEVWDYSHTTQTALTMAPSTPSHKVYCSYSVNEIPGIELIETTTLCRSYHLFNFATLTQNITSAKIRVLISSSSINPVHTTNVILQKCNNTGTLATSDFDNIDNATNYGIGSTRTVQNGISFTFDLTASAITQINNRGLFRFSLKDYANDYLGSVNTADTASSADVASYIELTF